MLIRKMQGGGIVHVPLGKMLKRLISSQNFLLKMNGIYEIPQNSRTEQIRTFLVLNAIKCPFIIDSSI